MRPAPAAGLALSIALSPAVRGDDPGLAVFTDVAQPPCALCHTLKAAGASGTVGPSLDDLKPDRTRTLRAVRNGVGVMPPYADTLTGEQIEAVADFVSDAAGGK